MMKQQQQSQMLNVVSTTGAPTAITDERETSSIQHLQIGNGSGGQHHPHHVGTNTA